MSHYVKILCVPNTSVILEVALCVMVGFLCRFLAETGLVSVEHQMQEMGLSPKESEMINKKSR